MTSSQRATRRPFTVALCGNCRAELGLPALEALRATIRRCDHGVLVVTECMLGGVSCGAHTRGPGVMVLLQPCSIERVPIGPTYCIGPIDQDDVCVLCDWVERGEWDYRDLPERLRGQVDWPVASNSRN